MAEPIPELILTGGKTNLKVVRTYANGLTLPQLTRAYDPLASFAQIMEYFTNIKLFKENEKILREASPIASGTMTAFSEKLPLDDPSLRDDDGKIYIVRTLNGITGRFGGFTLGQALKAGIIVDKPGAVLVANKGYVVNDDGKTNYTIDFQTQSLEHLKEIMGVFFSPDEPYANGQLRQVDPKFNLPLGKLSSSGPDEKNLWLYIHRPGPAVPSIDDDFGFDGRVITVLGGVYFDLGRFGAMVAEETAQPTKAEISAMLEQSRKEYENTLHNLMNAEPSSLSELGFQVER